MATDIVNTLFGVTPDSYQQAQQDRADAQALQFAQLDPFQRANYAIGRGANMLAGAVGGALGGQDPELQRITMRQQIAGQIDYNDMESIRKGGIALSQAGDTQGAMMLADIGRKLDSEMAQAEQRRAAGKASLATESKINLGVAQENKLRDELSRLPSGATEEQIRGVLVKYGDPDKILAVLKPKATDAVLMEQLGYPLTAAGYEAFNLAKQRELTPPSMVAEYIFAKTPAGGNFKGTYQDFVTARAIAGRAPAQPRAEQPPVAVVDPVSGKQVLVTREEALRNRMTPAAAIESLSPKDIQKREAALPLATSSIKGFESKSDKFITDLMALRDDPGLDNITGPIFGRTGSVTQAGSRAQALYDKVVAKGGFQSLQDLRDASKTGGALGNVSNQEGKQLIASFAAIDRRQNPEDVRAAINQAIADIQGTKTRMREAYDSTYSYKSGSIPSATPLQPATNVITNPKFPGFSIGK
jgi:hypothetical protein